MVAAACWWLGRAIVVDAGGVYLLLRTALLMLIWLVLFSTLGGVMHWRREELDFEPEHSPERDQRRNDRDRDLERNKFMDQVFAEFRSGNSRNAWSSIQRRAMRSADAIAEYLWIYDRVAGWISGSRLANQVAQELLPMLLLARRHGEALRIVRERVRVDPGFAPRTAGEVIKLAQVARDGGERPLARALLQDFDRHFPENAARTSARNLLDQLAR